jgi:hypothetical protein
MDCSMLLEVLAVLVDVSTLPISADLEASLGNVDVVDQNECHDMKCVVVLCFGFVIHYLILHNM